ncbi:MAG: hypothetical protein UH685_02165 [Bacteroidaceae bacterium]|nr:hypothetical protein [Bacteroidaceae bacterium]
MGTQEKYQNLNSHETGFFSAVCDMMQHSKVADGRRFLCAMNNIVDHFYERKQEEGINYQIIYVPTCPEWARELLVRFLIHKTAFSNAQHFINLAKKKTTGAMALPMGLSAKSKQYKQIAEERKYYAKFLKLFGEESLTNNSDSKSLFVVQEKDVVTRKQDKNPWLEQLYTTNLICNDDNTIVTNNLSAHDIENVFRKNRDNIPNIENLFVFHSQNRGKITFSYNLDQLDRFNQYGVGIKNCFVFYITERPFRLYYAKENVKSSLVANLLNREIKRFDDFDGFITFTPDELDLMFKREGLGARYIIDSTERDIFTAEIDSYLDELPHNYIVKNALSLAISPETQCYFIKECESETGISQSEVVSPFLNYYMQLWDDDIAFRILEQIENYHSVAFVLPPGIDNVYKKAIKKCFSSESRQIIIKDFNQLRDGLDEDFVVLFSFRYTDERYKTYPNSFDPLPLKKGQRGLTVINRLTHNRYYEWNKHFYEKDFNGLLFSSFRKEKLGWSKKVLQKPIMPDILSDIDEAESDAREYLAERCMIVFESGRAKRLAADRVLYVNGGRYCFSSLKELPFEEGMKLQLLDELVSQIKDNLIKKSDSDLKSEGYIRRDPSFALTEEQINSNIELWKYLLKRKVDELGVEATYEAIFPNNKEISLRGFEKWFDFDYPMILPRSRKSQNSLLSFLGFKIGSPYHRVILTKKLIKNNNTKVLNSQIESLLQSVLTVSSVSDDYIVKLYEEHSEILTLLEINSASDINILVQLLDINLKTVKSIKYDSDKA